ncbi:hypothetical protein TREES_T100007919 [Tupaia chinensis]|uniref:Uncharacterized protein n=1 Tax=Tupaia chinensis TaxID=246437 RepID=L9JCA2_TUPCH|nr:hypothetical protein TREES_T100007919 [Tupaia chinensis]
MCWVLPGEAALMLSTSLQISAKRVIPSPGYSNSLPAQACSSPSKHPLELSCKDVMGPALGSCLDAFYFPANLCQESHSQPRVFKLSAGPGETELLGYSLEAVRLGLVMGEAGVQFAVQTSPWISINWNAFTKQRVSSMRLFHVSAYWKTIDTQVLDDSIEVNYEETS